MQEANIHDLYIRLSGSLTVVMVICGYACSTYFPLSSALKIIKCQPALCGSY